MSLTTGSIAPSGVPPLDRRLGGLVQGRVHLLGGTTGSGKTTAALLFVDAGLRRGESAALVTHDNPADLRAHAAFLGLDIRRPWRDGRLIVIRYRRDAASRIGRTGASDAPAAELHRLLHAVGVSRIAVDSVGPLLMGGHGSAGALAALADLLDDSGATSLVTYPGDPAAEYDRRLEPLAQRAAGVFRLDLEPPDLHRLTVLKVRYARGGGDGDAYTIGDGGFHLARGFAAAPLRVAR